MSVITISEDGREYDDTFVTSIDSIMILKDMIGDDKVFDKNLEMTEYGLNKFETLKRKWCRENQHKNYDEMDEQIRYDDLYMAFSGKWIYIRFNPDKYKNSKGKLRNTKIDDRLLTLKREIEKQILRIKNDMNAEILERVYLYYDGYEHIDG